MMIVEMDRMKLVVVCYFNDQMIVDSFENIAATINFKMLTVQFLPDRSRFVPCYTIFQESIILILYLVKVAHLCI